MARIGVGTRVGRFFVFSSVYVGGLIYACFVVLGFLTILSIIYAIILNG